MPVMPPTNTLEQGVRKGLGYLWDKYAQAMEVAGPTLDAYDMATRNIPQQVPPGLGRMVAIGASNLDEAVRAPLAMAAGAKGLEKIFKWAENLTNANTLMKKEADIKKAIDSIARKAKITSPSDSVDPFSAMGNLYEKWEALPENAGKSIDDFFRTVKSDYVAYDILRDLKKKNPDAVSGIEIADDVANPIGEDVTPSRQVQDTAPNPEQAMIAQQEALPLAERFKAAGGEEAVANINSDVRAKEIFDNWGTLDAYFKKRAEVMGMEGTKGVTPIRTGEAALARSLNLRPDSLRLGALPSPAGMQDIIVEAAKAPTLQNGRWLKDRFKNIPLKFQQEAADSMGKIGTNVLQWAQGNYKVSDAARRAGVSPEEMLSHLNTFYKVASENKARELAMNPPGRQRKPWRLSASQIREIKGVDK